MRTHRFCCIHGVSGSLVFRVTKENELFESGVLFRIVSVSCVLYVENTNRRSTNFSLVERKGQTEYLETKNTRWIANNLRYEVSSTYRFRSLDVTCIAKQTPNAYCSDVKTTPNDRTRRSIDRSCWKQKSRWFVLHLRSLSQNFKLFSCARSCSTLSINALHNFNDPKIIGQFFTNDVDFFFFTNNIADYRPRLLTGIFNGLSISSWKLHLLSAWKP